LHEWNSDFSGEYAEHRWIQVFQRFRDGNSNHTVFSQNRPSPSLTIIRFEWCGRTNHFVDEQQFMDGRKGAASSVDFKSDVVDKRVNP